MSYATILIPSSGILDAYAASPHDLSSALGIYLATCACLTIFAEAWIIDLCV